MKTKTKISTTTAAVLLGISTLASANPPGAPAIYDNGPASPLLNMTNMRDTERTAFALYEALMQATEALVYVKGCTPFSVPVEAFSDGSNNVGFNFLEVQTFGGVRLQATLQPPVPGFGQNIDVVQAPANGVLNNVAVDSLRGRYTYNHLSNLMVGERTAVRVAGQNGRPDQFYSAVIKDFYHGNTFSSDPGSFFEIFDYGLQSVSKSGFPVNKWWQKSKAVRDNGQQGCTVFQKDRLVGAGACRITLSTVGYSQPGLFWQDGNLTVSQVTPSAPDTELNSCNLVTF